MLSFSCASWDSLIRLGNMLKFLGRFLFNLRVQYVFVVLITSSTKRLSAMIFWKLLSKTRTVTLGKFRYLRCNHSCCSLSKIATLLLDHAVSYRCGISPRIFYHNFTKFRELRPPTVVLELSRRSQYTNRTLNRTTIQPELSVSQLSASLASFYALKRERAESLMAVLLKYLWFCW